MVSRLSLDPDGRHAVDLDARIAHQLAARPFLFVDRRPLGDRWLQISTTVSVDFAWPARLRELRRR